jgi:hypothetical protein
MFSHAKVWEERNGELSHQADTSHSFFNPFPRVFVSGAAHFSPIHEREPFSVIAWGYQQ